MFEFGHLKHTNNTKKLELISKKEVKNCFCKNVSDFETSASKKKIYLYCEKPS